ncbi:MAG: hypothetical protein AAB618_00585 [Patescibacteria group bacterium]
MKKTLKLLSLTALLVFPGLTQAAEVSFSPTLIDLELEAREVVTRDITITNETASKIHLYATVNEIDIDNAGAIKEFVAPVMDDRTTAITSWIEITRGRIELEANETKTVPLIVHVNQNAVTGEYHAFIGLVKEANRPLAEAKVMAGTADGIILKVALEDKAAASLRITSFLADRFMVREASQQVEVTIKNEGSKTTAPLGEVVFYNSKGEEIASESLSTSGMSLEPGQSETMAVRVPFSHKLGRFKANLVVRYGKDNQQAVFDTTQFYLIPPRYLIIVIVLVISLSLLITYLLRRMFYDELQDDEDGNEVPLYVSPNKEHITHDHDIHLTKN